MRKSRRDAPGSRLAEARAAMARGAWKKARTLFEAICARGETAEALEGLGWAAWWLDDLSVSIELRERAYRLYRRRGESRAAARVAVAIGVDCFDLHGEAVTVGWMQRARRLLGRSTPCPERGWLELWEGHVVRFLHNDCDAARHHAREAAAIANALGLSELELLAEALMGLILVSERHVAEGMKRLDEATAAAVSGDITDLDAVGAACCFLVYACEQSRDQRRASQWAQRIEALCKRWQVRSLFAVCRTQHAAMLLWEGRWREAEGELDESARVLAASRPAAAAQAVALLGELRRRQGRVDEAAELFARADGLSLSYIGRAILMLENGDLGSAETLIDRAIRRASPDNWAMRLAAMELLVQCLLLRGNQQSAAEILAGMRPMSDAVGTAPLAAIAYRAEGRFAQATGSLEVARRKFEDAVDLFDAAHTPYEAAQSRLNLAEILCRMGQKELAINEAMAAKQGFERLGATRESMKAAEFLREIRSRAAKRSATAGLTTREIEVLALIAQGLSDKQVAARLKLSQHTVHRHVSNVLVRLAVPSRAAAVAHASRHGLLEPAG